MLNFFRNVIAWLILSSKDADRVSLTLKAGLLAGLAYLVQLTGLAHITFDTQWATELINSLAAFVQLALYAISVLAGVYGAARKLWLTFTGKNEVVALIKASSKI